MLVPLKWLRDYVDIDIDTQEFADMMTMTGSKVEKVDYFGKETNGVEVCKILEIEQHPDADRLKVTKVEVANGEAPILIGTKLAIRKLQGVVDVASDKMLDAKNEHGMMAVWQGIPCMEIAQGHKIGTFEFTMPNDKVYIVAGNAKPVKMVLEGHTEVKEVSEELTADGAVENIVRFKAGCAVVYGGAIGEITLA